MEKNTLDELLEIWQVDSAGIFENEFSKLNPTWHAVSNDSGIVAYFAEETDAFMFRLDKINNILNS